MMVRWVAAALELPLLGRLLARLALWPLRRQLRALVRAPRPRRLLAGRVRP
jgi:hypothetical protein